MRQGMVTMALAAMVGMSSVSPALADPGDLDTTFNGVGYLTTNSASGFEFAWDVAIQSDGKIVVVGSGFSGDLYRDDFIVVRYNPNGTLDPTFGVGGKVITNIGPLNCLCEGDEANAVAIQPDGKILVAGWSVTTFGLYSIVAVRYDANGILDPTFGAGGIQTINLSNQRFKTNLGRDMLLQPDGKIVIGGSTSIEFNNFDFGLVRLNSDGSLDPTFGSMGKVTLDLGFNNQDQILALAFQPDGKYLAAGWTYDGSDTFFALARFNSNGIPDPGFGVGGTIVLDFPGFSAAEARGITLQGDGKILLVGKVSDPVVRQLRWAVARFNANGTLDTGFGGGGRVVNHFPGTQGGILNDVALQPNGKIIGAGYMAQLGTKFGLVRYNTNGSLDTDFGTGGMVIQPIVGNDVGTSLALQNDGNIVVAGFSESRYFSVARFEGGELNEPPIANAGPDQTVDENTLVTLDGSGSFDPDSDPLSYSWTQIAGPAVLLSDPTTVMPTFTTPDITADTILTFELIVNDGQFDSDPDTVNITVRWVPTPTELTQNLIDTVIGFGLPDGLTNSLLAKLNAVLKKIETNPDTACNNLDSFINQVQAQSGKKIDEGQATLVIILANDIKALLGC